MQCGAIVLRDAASWTLFFFFHLFFLSNLQPNVVNDSQDQSQGGLRGFATWWISFLSFDIFFIRMHWLTRFTYGGSSVLCRGFTLPPEESRARHSWKWDLWVFYSPQANPSAPPPLPPRPQNWSNHKWSQVGEWVCRRGWCWIYIFIAKTEQCWLNLTWVTFSRSRHWFALISVKLCQGARKQRRKV